jgi:hypothetical protein
MNGTFIGLAPKYSITKPNTFFLNGENTFIIKLD